MTDPQPQQPDVQNVSDSPFSEPPPVQLSANVSQVGAKILVVDDDQNYTDLLVEVLTEAGFQVHVASDGQAGLEYLKQHDADLIILDMLMPNVDGATFVYELHNSLQKTTIPVLILTNSQAVAFPYDVAGFISKLDTTLDKIVEKVRQKLPVG